MYSKAFFRLTFGGHLFTGAEEWQCGVNFAPPGTETAQDLVDALPQIGLGDIFDDLAPNFTTAMGDLQYTNSTTLSWVKLAVINTNGEYATDARTHSQTVTGLNTTGAISPAQLAVAVSLWDGSSVGTGHRGRFYLPFPGAGISYIGKATGQMPEIWCTTLRDNWSASLSAVQGEISTLGAPVQLSIMSQTGASGATHVVQRIGVGRVPDTQRRRRNHLDDIKSWADYTG